MEQAGGASVGDGSLSVVGGGVRVGPDLDGPLVLGGRAELGGSFYSSPLDPEFYASEVVAYFGSAPATGFRSGGARVGVGGDIGVELARDQVAAEVSMDVGYLTNPGFGVTYSTRLAAVAWF